MEAVYLDTHIVVWLFAKELEKFSKQTIELIENNELYISPIVELELEFLYEIGRIRYSTGEIVSELSETIFLKISNIEFQKITMEATKHKWTRDPFDRIIVANASYHDKKLITKDRNILKNYSLATF